MRASPPIGAEARPGRGGGWILGAPYLNQER
jgi:hypothetical protein